MSDLARAFDHGKAFIAFLTCGDPDLETTAAAVRAAAQNGADLIELGIPFSDPTAEGPVIQAANLRALQSGVTTDKIFDLVRELRRGVTIPMVFMTYANVVFSYGTERFLSNCRDVGIDGLILPDVPYEEKEEFLPACRKYGVDFVSLIAPTSENRIAMIAREAEGFLYIVSSLGVTGERSKIKTDLASIVSLVRENTDIPCAIGFGISTPEQAKKMADLSDGAIVGSAIVRLLAQYGMESYVSSMSNLRRMEDAQPEYKLIDLQTVASSLYDSAKIVCAKNGKELILQNDMPVSQLSLDGAFVSQVSNNLISNAVRYARTAVTISFALRDDGLLLSVSDDGKGFDKNGLQKATSPYYTEESNHSEHFGLGLYICKLLCEHHNGYLKIENTASGAKVSAYHHACSDFLRRV